jgi:hypothetical protein
MTTDPNDTTLSAYEAAADSYIERTIPPPPVVLAYLDRFAGLVGHGHVLELGSSPGWDAAYPERRGVQATRSDATRAFVDRLRAAGITRNCSTSLAHRRGAGAAAQPRARVMSAGLMFAPGAGFALWGIAGQYLPPDVVITGAAVTGGAVVLLLRPRVICSAGRT